MDQKILSVILLVSVGVLILCCLKKKNKDSGLKENFADTMQNFLVQPENITQRNTVPAPWLKNIGNDYNPYNTFFLSKPNAKAMVSPRFSNINYSSHLRGQEPPLQMLASGPEPVPNDHAELLSRAFGSGQANPMIPGDIAGKSESELNHLYEKYENKMLDQQTMLETSDLLPSPQMDTGIGDTYFGKNIADPETYTYSGNITVLQKHRNAEGGNPFAGDLLIPGIQTGWFQPAQIRSAASILKPGYFSSSIGSPIDTDEDNLDTTVIAHRNEDYQNGIQYKRM